MSTEVSERALIFLIGAVQFVNVLDFMIVMPLGPDFATALHIPGSQLSLISGSYAVSASIMGLLGALFLDRFDRRTALGVAMLGLVIGTAAGGFGTGLYSMMGARVLAGVFGGPATSLSMSILTDVVPAERRGRALGAVMGAVSVASVLGLPAGLWLARSGGWRAPFFAIAGIGLFIAVLSILLMPPMRRHIEAARAARLAGQPADASIFTILRRPEARLALTAGAALMIGGFALIPNIATYLQHNGKVPRQAMEYLYAVGGCVSFVAMRFAGRLVDHYGSARISLFSTLLWCATLAAGFLFGRPLIPAVLLFALYFLGQGGRNVSMNTLTTRVPRATERARYQSLQSAVQHMASAIGSGLGALFLTERADKTLDGMTQLTMLTICCALVQPPLLALISRHLRAREAVPQGAAPAMPSGGTATPPIHHHHT